MILSYLLLAQVTAWPAIPTKATTAWYRGPEAVLEISTKVTAKLGTEEVLLFPSAATQVKIGAATLLFSKGRLTLDNGRSIPTASANVGSPLELAVTRNKGDVQVFANGSLFTALKIKDATISLSVEGEGLQLLAGASYYRVLTGAEIKKNASAGIALANSLPDSPLMGLELKMLATTQAPDPSRIKPYRNALIAQEYTVQSVVSGHTKGLKQGAKVRVFRYGVFDGKKTGVDNLKAAPATVTVELMSANPARSHEYQIDDLDSDMLAKYYVEVATPKK